MAKNTFKNQKNTKLDSEARQGKSVFDKLGAMFNIENKVENMPNHYLQYALWVVALVFMYIFAQHSNEAQVRQVDKLKDSLEVLRLEYVSKKASFMQATKKSEMLKKVQPLGLEENIDRPEKIQVEK